MVATDFVALVGGPFNMKKNNYGQWQLTILHTLSNRETDCTTHNLFLVGDTIKQFLIISVNILCREFKNCTKLNNVYQHNSLVYTNLNQSQNEIKWNF